MATTDLSRSAFDPAKRYAGVQMQQGRVILDSDWNEAGAIAAESARRALLDVVGPHGTQDDGFRIQHPTVDAATGTVDFTIGAGSYYVGGLRAGLDAAESYRLQSDWLELAPESAPSATRLDLVYLELWQQAVGAVEDDELREVALGGPDTSTRLRTMARVAVEDGIAAADCAAAWSEAVARWVAAGEGALDGSNELTTSVKLTVGYAAGDDGDDLCEPSVAGGYLGAENQAIRVQLVDGATFTWGFDNASPLYRMQLGNDRTSVTMLNAPPDQAHWPLAGDVVEVLPWGAVLPNGEKVAEIAGHMTTVAESYRPDAGTLALTDSVPATLDRWAGRADATALGTAYYYLRVWQRGSERDEPPAIACPSGTPVTLGHTGISVTLSAGYRRAGDHWIIAARPEAPDQVVPWALESGRTPHGIRRFRAPLAIVRWSVNGTTVTGTVVSDCRKPFRPLTALDPGPCTVVARPGDDLQAAIDALPPGGGELCLSAGTFRLAGPVTVSGRRRIVVNGVGPATVVRAVGSEAVFVFERCEEVEVRHLRAEGGMATGAAAAHLNGALTFVGSTSVRVLECDVSCVDGSGSRIATCVTVRALPDGTARPDQVRIGGNRLRVGAWQTGVLVVDPVSATVTGNDVRLAPGSVRLVRAAGQGIVISGTRVGSVQVLDNVIEGAVQGIHIGASNARVSGRERVEEIMVARNVVHLSIPAGYRRERHAVFIGNARSASVLDTVATLTRPDLRSKTRALRQQDGSAELTNVVVGRGRTGTVAGKDQAEAIGRLATPVEAIRVHGVLGPFLVVRQSSTRGFTIGVRVAPLAPVPASRMWVVSETMADGSAAALVAPVTVDRARNVP